MNQDKARAFAKVFVPALMLTIATFFCLVIGLAIWLQSPALGVPSGVLGAVSFIATGAHTEEIVNAVTLFLTDEDK